MFEEFDSHAIMVRGWNKKPDREKQVIKISHILTDKV
jgi:hypothetical protein